MSERFRNFFCELYVKQGWVESYSNNRYQIDTEMSYAFDDAIRQYPLYFTLSRYEYLKHSS